MVKEPITRGIVPWDPQEAERLKALADLSHEEFWAAHEKGLDTTIAKMKLDDAFSAYHRYLKQK